MRQPEYAAENLHQKVDELVGPYIGSPGNVGVVVGVICGGEQHVFGYGKLARDADATPDEHTVFEIGSITKVFTANLLMEMAGRGELKPDDPVAKFLPPTVRVPERAGQAITLLHLATHTASLPPMPGNWEKAVQDPTNPYAHYTVEHLYQFLGECRLRRPVGSRAEYSNLGVGLLGHALSLCAGRPYEDLLRERISGPLGLNDTSITLSDDQRGRLARGHSANGQPVSNWDIPTLAGAGALRSTVAQMLTYLNANLKPAETSLQAALEGCHVSHKLPWSGWSVVRPVLWAVGLSAASLAIQRFWPVPPGSLTFGIVFLAPILLCAAFGGLLLALASLALCLAGSHWLWGSSFGWWPATTASLFFTAIIIWLRWAIVGQRSWLPAVAPFLASEEVLPGWQSLTGAGGVRIIWHNGGTGGYRSFIGFVKESQTAVAVLSNSENSVDEIGIQLLEYLHHANAVWASVRRVHRRLSPARSRGGPLS